MKYQVTLNERNRLRNASDGNNYNNLSIDIW